MPLDLGSHHVDLTALIQNVTVDPITWGRFSDFYLGDLIVTNKPRKVVVKVLRGLTSGRYSVSRARKLLNREVSIVSRLEHPNIAEYLGVTHHLGQRPAIVMASYPLGDAPTFLVGRPVDERLHLINGVMEGLCYLHSRRPAIAHGDIKGVNILVNASFEGVLSDFGLSQVVKGGAESTEDPADSLGTNGTTRWMARELIHDEPGVPPAAGPTLSSDVWAFGCTFCELLLGMIPYSSRKHPSLVIQDIVHGVLPFSDENAPRIGPDEMWTVVVGCWSPAPGDRPTIFELKSELSALYD